MFQARAYPCRTPRSSTGQTLRRRSWNIRYISAVQRPIPRTVVNRSINSSSLRREVRVRTTVPSSTLAERSRSEASLFAEAGGPELGVGGRVQRLRRQYVADGGAQPAVDRLRGAAGELLEDDRAHEGGERPVRVARAVA